MPGVEQYVTLQCISNFVGGDLVGTAKWTGVPLRAVLARAGGVAPRAVRVAFHAVSGYTDSLPVAKALDPATMVAYGMNDQSLPRAHGYPARIIVPGIYGMKNVKWLQRIEVVDYDYRGYWQRSDGWDNIAQIKLASRIDVPAEMSAVDGEIVVAGVAWAGDRGIRRVEVSADDGRTWTPGSPAARAGAGGLAAVAPALAAERLRPGRPARARGRRPRRPPARPGAAAASQRRDRLRPGGRGRGVDVTAG
jgi:hypothetical protein